MAVAHLLLLVCVLGSAGANIDVGHVAASRFASPADARAASQVSLAPSLEATVSVLLVSPFSRPQALLFAVDNILFTQKFQDFELIIVDDSRPCLKETDFVTYLTVKHSEAEVLKALDKVDYICDPKKTLSMGMKKNIALEKARGQFVAFWDVDDIYGADRLEAQLQAFTQNPRLDMVFLGWKYIFEVKTNSWIKYVDDDGESVAAYSTLIARLSSVNKFGGVFAANGEKEIRYSDSAFGEEMGFVSAMVSKGATFETFNLPWVHLHFGGSGMEFRKEVIAFREVPKLISNQQILDFSKDFAPPRTILNRFPDPITEGSMNELRRRASPVDGQRYYYYNEYNYQTYFYDQPPTVCETISWSEVKQAPGETITTAGGITATFKQFLLGKAQFGAGNGFPSATSLPTDSRFEVGNGAQISLNADSWQNAGVQCMQFNQPVQMDPLTEVKDIDNQPVHDQVGSYAYNGNVLLNPASVTTNSEVIATGVNGFLPVNASVSNQFQVPPGASPPTLIASVRRRSLLEGGGPIEDMPVVDPSTAAFFNYPTPLTELCFVFGEDGLYNGSTRLIVLRALTFCSTNGRFTNRNDRRNVADTIAAIEDAEVVLGSEINPEVEAVNRLEELGFQRKVVKNVLGRFGDKDPNSNLKQHTRDVAFANTPSPTHNFSVGMYNNLGNHYVAFVYGAESSPVPTQSPPSMYDVEYIPHVGYSYVYGNASLFRRAVARTSKEPEKCEAISWSQVSSGRHHLYKSSTGVALMWNSFAFGGASASSENGRAVDKAVAGGASTHLGFRAGIAAGGYVWNAGVGACISFSEAVNVSSVPFVVSGVDGFPSRDQLGFYAFNGNERVYLTDKDFKLSDSSVLRKANPLAVPVADAEVKLLPIPSDAKDSLAAVESVVRAKAGSSTAVTSEDSKVSVTYPRKVTSICVIFGSAGKSSEDRNVFLGSVTVCRNEDQ